MIKWGIMGAGNIAHRFAESLSKTESGSLYAIANRTLKKAEAFQEKFSCEKIYDNYNQLIKDENVQIIYLSLPHKYHYEWVKAALLNHKSVLCEKPATMNAQQMQEIKAIAQQQGVLFMEAMKNRYVPVYDHIKETIQKGTIGELTSLSTSLCKEIPKEHTTYHYLPEQGGCLLDLGIYNIGFLDGLIHEPLTVEQVDYEKGSYAIETYVNATLKTNNLTVQIETAFDRNKPALATIIGELGTITVENFHRPTSYTVQLDAQSPHRYEYPFEGDDFSSEIKEAMFCLENNRIESHKMPLQSSLNCAHVIEDIKSFIS